MMSIMMIVAVVFYSQHPNQTMDALRESWRELDSIQMANVYFWSANLMFVLFSTAELFSFTFMFMFMLALMCVGAFIGHAFAARDIIVVVVVVAS